MIIKSNLASRPTRNFTLYFIGCLLLAVTAVGFTVFNLTSLVSSQEKTSGLRDRIAEQKRQRTDAANQAAALRNRIAAIKTEAFVNETEFLNNAIKRRVFSWTALFDQFEALFPNNVKMTSVIPSISGEDISIRMDVTGRELKDIVALIKSLQSSPVFSDVVFRSERQEKDGSLQASITLQYKPEGVIDDSGNPKDAADSKTAKSGEKEL